LHPVGEGGAVARGHQSTHDFTGLGADQRDAKKGSSWIMPPFILADGELSGL